MWGDSFNVKRIYLSVPFREKDKAKALGARWDADEKRWFYTNPEDKDNFKQWADDEVQKNGFASWGTKNAKKFMTFEELSEEQQELIVRAKNGENVLVDACIGSGKTTAIQVLCNEIIGKEILYLTYNTLLKIDAREKIKASNVTVTNYHGFAYMCLANAQIKSGVSDLIQTFNKNKPALLKHYDIVVLDEYQDIEQEIAEMLMYIKSECRGVQLIAVGDMQQKIYDKTTLNVPAFINGYLDDYTTLSFTKCFRLNAEHAKRLGRVWGKEINGVNNDCRIETIEIANVVDFLAKQNPADIICLGARTGSMSQALNVLESKFPKKYNKHTVYASITDEDRSKCMPSSDTAIFTTYDSSKGLERKICVIFDYTDSYWLLRNNFPAAKYEILRNIFCVAASRGKSKIVFVKNNGNGQLLDLEKEDNLLTIPVKMNLNFFKKPFYVSEMFDFKYKEDVEECYSMLKVKRLHQINEDVIDIPSADGKIDLSPCIGKYLEAKFFKGYDIDQMIEFARSMPDRPNFSTGLWKNEEVTTDHKILLLTALETCYERYIHQVKPPFVTEIQGEMLFDRLKTKFDGHESVQAGIEMPLFTEDGIISVTGKCDVIKDDKIYELKFVTELQHEHFLQLAMYLVMFDKSKGFLWNVKNNEFYEVGIPKKQREKFIDTVVRTITKGVISKCVQSNGLKAAHKNKKAV